MSADYSPKPQPGAGSLDRPLRLQLAQLLRCSEQMLACARGGDWQTVEEMERLRRPDLEQCLSKALLAQDSSLITEAVATLMHLNEELVRQVGRARDEVLGSQAGLEKGRQAATAYRRSGGGL